MKYRIILIIAALVALAGCSRDSEDARLARIAAMADTEPKFISNHNLLTSHNLTQIDMRTALLIKCHIKPSQMRILLGRSNGAIVSRREMLCVKIFDKKMGTKVMRLLKMVHGLNIKIITKI